MLQAFAGGLVDDSDRRNVRLEHARADHQGKHPVESDASELDDVHAGAVGLLFRLRSADPVCGVVLSFESIVVVVAVGSFARSLALWRHVGFEPPLLQRRRHDHVLSRFVCEAGNPFAGALHDTEQAAEMRERDVVDTHRRLGGGGGRHADEALGDQRREADAGLEEV